MPRDVKILLFSASLRAGSLNTKLARIAKRIMSEQGASVDWASMKEFDAPSYDGDAHAASGAAAHDNCREGRRENCDDDARRLGH